MPREGRGKKPEKEGEFSSLACLAGGFGVRLVVLKLALVNDYTTNRRSQSSSITASSDSAKAIR